MNKLIWISCLALLAACSQTNRKQNDIPEISIDIRKADVLKTSAFADEITYIPLADTLPIGEMDKAKIYSEKLYILSNRMILIYNIRTGKNVLTIHKPGKGPGEYQSLTDLVVDEQERLIEVLDMKDKKILRYDMDGRFKDHFRIPFSSFSFHKVSNTDYLFYNNNLISETTDHKLIRYNPGEERITAQYIPIDQHMATYFYLMDGNNFKASATGLYFHYCPADTVYRLEGEYKPVPQYSVYFNTNHVPASFYKEGFSDIADFSEKAKKRDYIFAIVNFDENEQMLALSFRKDLTWYWALYNKRNNSSLIAGSIQDDYHFNQQVKIEYENGPFILDHDYMYFFMLPHQLLELKNNRLLPHEDNSLNRIYNSGNFSENSNPALLICRLK